MKIKKKNFCFLLGAALLASFSAGCGNGSEEPASARQQAETEENEAEVSGNVQETAPGESIQTNGGESIALASLETISLTSLEHQDETSSTTVYYTSEISPEAMTAVYAALAWN